jgi:hypothetical protein
MASRKRTLERSRLARDRTVAYARKQKTSADDGGDGDAPDEKTDPEAKPIEATKTPEPKPEPKPAGKPGPDTG